MDVYLGGLIDGWMVGCLVGYKIKSSSLTRYKVIKPSLVAIIVVITTTPTTVETRPVWWFVTSPP